MFNDRFGLTQAVLNGRKTQTRRMLTHKAVAIINGYGFREAEDKTIDEMVNTAPSYFIENRAPYKKGETLAVAQSYSDISDYYYSLGKFNERKVTEQELIFHNAMRIMESTGDDSAMRGDDNKMFVRAELMPHQIRITNIRLERLQDISDEDCLAEGIRRWEDEDEYSTSSSVRKSIEDLKAAGYEAYAIPGYWDCYTSPKKAYAALIEKVSGKGTWEKNPWVFVYDFELVK